MAKPIYGHLFRMTLWGLAAWIAASALRTLRVSPEANLNVSRPQGGSQGALLPGNSPDSQWSDGWSN